MRPKHYRVHLFLENSFRSTDFLLSFKSISGFSTVNPLIGAVAGLVCSTSCPYRAPIIPIRTIDNNCCVLYCSLAVVAVVVSLAS